MKTTKTQRLEIVNKIIVEIASRGRKFFYYKGNVAELFIKNNKIYYKCEWISEYKPITEICLSIADYTSPKGWFHGGTLLDLMKEFCYFIKTGNYSYDGRKYSGLSCYYWAYPEEDIKIIQEKAIELGYTISQESFLEIK